MANEKRFKWTKAKKDAAKEELLALANEHEPKKKKALTGVFFTAEGQAWYFGKSHDYIYHAPVVEIVK